MNVINTFEESAQWRKPIAAPPAPYTETPYVNQQVDNAFGEATVFDPNAQPVMQVVPQEPTYEENLRSRLDKSMQAGSPVLFDFLEKGTPPLDEKRQQRLKFAAGLSALGQGMSTLYGGYMGAKGGPILAQENNFTPAALKEYNDRINADNEAKYRNAMAKFQFGQNVFGQTSRQMEIEQQRKENAKAQQSQNEYISGREDKKMAQDQARFDKTFNLSKEQNAGALKMNQDQLKEQIRNNKSESGYKYYAANLNDKLYREGLKGQTGSGKLTEKFNTTSVVPVQMANGTILYIDGYKAWEVLGKVAERTSKDASGYPAESENPLVKRMGNNDFTIGEASALIATYGMDLLENAPNAFQQAVQSQQANGVPYGQEMAEPIKPNQNASRKPTQPAKSKGKYEIQTW